MVESEEFVCCLMDSMAQEVSMGKIELLFKQESPPLGNCTRHTACSVTCPGGEFPVLARGNPARSGVPPPKKGTS